MRKLLSIKIKMKHNYLNLLLFVAIIVLVVSILYSFNNNFITFDPSTGINLILSAKIIDLNIPMHVIPNAQYPTYYFIPDGKYDGQSILFLFDDVNPNYNPGNIIFRSYNFLGFNPTYFVSNKQKNSTNFRPFDQGTLSPRTLYRMVWFNKSWFIDNDNFFT